ncbi:hypothetical protein HU200_031840 [Digitaria exilis]|uniref:Uncharacterized protein n=1 Tax=Digitaria exilis TaxID=1010633 RepID=A0A835EM25_9POAL|nr:hypothetical protein HU200_031840 [Digitaria exilis]
METEVRRSLRVRSSNDGFKRSTCSQKGCLGCSASPPALSMKAIQKIGESICMITPATLSKEALKKKAKERRPIGTKKNPKKPALHVKGKGKKKIEDVQDEDDEE